MNYVQFALFIFYLICLFLSGAGIYSILNKSEIRFNKVVCVGEFFIAPGFYVISIEKIKRELRWQPTVSPRQGVARLVRWV